MFSEASLPVLYEGFGGCPVRASPPTTFFPVSSIVLYLLWYYGESYYFFMWVDAERNVAIQSLFRGLKCITKDTGLILCLLID